MSSKNDITGDVIRTKNSSSAYSAGWDRIFGNKKDALQEMTSINEELGLYDIQWDGHLIDPPTGWKYGFPKEFKLNEHKTFRNLLLISGYPEKDIDFALQYMRIMPK